MSDAHEEHNGGHELEGLNAIALMKVIFGLSAIVMVACIIVVQFFYSQAREMEFEGSTPYYLQKYWGEMDADKAGLAATVKDAANNPATMKAGPPPAGWKHPDDVKLGN